MFPQAALLTNRSVRTMKTIVDHSHEKLTYWTVGCKMAANNKASDLNFFLRKTGLPQKNKFRSTTLES